MDPSAWRWTRLDEPQPEVLGLIKLQAGELPVVSFFRSETSWYLFTTRRILGRYSGQAVDLAALDVVNNNFGNFKGHGGRENEVMTLQSSSGQELKLEYETGAAPMAPMYYLVFWKRKFPILDNLKVDP